MKQVIKPEPTYNSEIAKAKGGTLEEAGNEIMKNAIGCLDAVLTGMDFLKLGYPGYKFNLENIMQTVATVNARIKDLQNVMFKDLNSGQNEEATQ